MFPRMFSTNVSAGPLSVSTASRTGRSIVKYFTKLEDGIEIVKVPPTGTYLLMETHENYHSPI
ncbi:MAG: hypothetical protein QW816_04115 [Desulfurococcaceae archaeon]